jgi:hypothetical protein
VAADIAKAIAGRAGKGLTAKAYGTELFGVDVQAAGFQLMLDEGVVEVDVVSDEDGPGEPFMYDIRYLIEIGRIGNHFVVDAGEGLHITGDRHSGIDEGLISSKLPDSIV